MCFGFHTHTHTHMYIYTHTRIPGIYTQNGPLILHPSMHTVWRRLPVLMWALLLAVCGRVEGGCLITQRGWYAVCRIGIGDGGGRREEGGREGGGREGGGGRKGMREEGGRREGGGRRRNDHGVPGVDIGAVIYTVPTSHPKNDLIQP